MFVRSHRCVAVAAGYLALVACGGRPTASTRPVPPGDQRSVRPAPAESHTGSRGNVEASREIPRSELRTGGTLLATLSHGDLVLGAAFSRDGMRVVTASVDKTARTWNGKTGEPGGCGDRASDRAPRSMHQPRARGGSPARDHSPRAATSAVFCGRGHPLWKTPGAAKKVVLSHPFAGPPSAHPLDGWPAHVPRRVTLRPHVLEPAIDACLRGDLLAVLPHEVVGHLGLTSRLRAMRAFSLAETPLFASRLRPFSDRTSAVTRLLDLLRK